MRGEFCELGTKIISQKCVEIENFTELNTHTHTWYSNIDFWYRYARKTWIFVGKNAIALELIEQLFKPSGQENIKTSSKNKTKICSARWWTNVKLEIIIVVKTYIVNSMWTFINTAPIGYECSVHHGPPHLPPPLRTILFSRVIIYQADIWDVLTPPSSSLPPLFVFWTVRVCTYTRTRKNGRTVL